MSDTIKSISSICNQLINKSTNTKTKNIEEFLNVSHDAICNPDMHQEIILNRESCDFYANVKNNIQIELFTAIFFGPPFKKNNIDKGFLELLDKKKQIIENSSWDYRISMQTWDISIHFNENIVSQKISEDEFVCLDWAIIKEEECFIKNKKVTPGDRWYHHYSLIASTEEDLKRILTELTQLL